MANDSYYCLIKSDLNQDGRVDQILSDYSLSITQPYLIIWGGDYLVGDTTFIKYPVSNQSSSDFSLIDFNNDGFKDLFFNLKYDRDSSGTIIKNASSIVIFNQKNIASEKVLDLNSITATQTYPYYAMKLDTSNFFNAKSDREQIRDNSYTYSYEIQSLNIDVVQNHTTSIVSDDLLAHCIVFPNPATDNAAIIINDLDCGEYQIKIVDIEGKEMLTFNTAVTSTSHHINLNTSQLTNNTYSLAIMQDNKIIITQKFIILK
jgi:hypothetical protein